MLNTTTFDKMNNRSSEVTTDFLSMGVYKMKIVNIEEHKTAKNEDNIKVTIDTGFKSREGGTRMMYSYYKINGTYLDKKSKEEKPCIDLFVGFMKQCFGVEKFDQIAINKCIGQSLAVATKRDEDGYFSFWYAGNINNIVNMQKSYSPKDESNGKRPEGTDVKKVEGTIPPVAPDEVNDNVIIDPETGKPIF
jgi:hypothetical protein